MKIITGKYIFKKWHLAFILLAGTAVRFIYGYSSKAWLAAPDQLAWGLSIDEMLHSKAWSYIQLIHAPHEGGSFFISLSSLLFRPLQFILPSLSFAALCIDTLSRYIQIRLAQKIFGVQTAVCFGIWSILSVPLLIPWGTVNFGLHSLVSFVPFVFFYLAVTYREHKYAPVICGLASGIAVSLSYDSIILVPASVLVLLFARKDANSKAFSLLTYAAVFTLAMLPHIFTRTYFYTGFSLETHSALAIRGVPLANVVTTEHIKNLFTVWYKPLPGCFLLSSVSFLSAGVTWGIVFLFLVTGILFYLWKGTVTMNAKWLSVSIISLFMIAYAIGPFYADNYNNKSYVYYRHLCYIIPFLTVLLINGFLDMGKWRWIIVSAWILLCGIASVQYISSAQPIEKPAYRAAAWILVKKYGEDTHKLLQLQAMAASQSQPEFMTGFGWGLSAAILKGRTDTASVDRLLKIIDQFPIQYQPQLVNGIYYSFSKGITPVLDKQLLPILDLRLQQKNGPANTTRL